MNEHVAPADDPATSVLAEFRSAGWTADHLGRDGGRLECGGCGRVAPASDFAAEAAHRIEGASDPDDLQLVIGARCPSCGSPGTFVVAFGPTAGARDLDLIAPIDLGSTTDPTARPRSR